MKPLVTLYADGATHPTNPGHAGYGVVLRFSCGSRLELSEGYRWSSNNRMEILAAIVGLRAIETPSEVEVVSDSNYVVNTINGWMEKWKKRNWKVGKQKKPVLNQDLWLEVDRLMSIHQVTARWIRGHTGLQDIDSRENDRCDTLAVKTACDSANWHLDRPYEIYNPPHLRPSRFVSAPRPSQLSLSEHNAIVQSELVWSDAELAID